MKYDLEVKAIAYARAGILDYWVLDVGERRLHVFWQPDRGVDSVSDNSGGDVGNYIDRLPRRYYFHPRDVATALGREFRTDLTPNLTYGRIQTITL